MEKWNSVNIMPGCKLLLKTTNLFSVLPIFFMTSHPFVEEFQLSVNNYIAQNQLPLSSELIYTSV